jgi:nitrate/nitrite transporter NarK
MFSSIRWRSFVTMFCLVFLGEAIFSLPFHVTRFFRPTVLDVFGCTNFELGVMFSAYGWTGMIAYFPGGAIADRFSARRLMTVAALSTALGGLYMATIPSVTGMTLLYGYWGITSILLFWAAMIRATREWGGSSDQGRAFGILDGGRGLVAAGVASITVYFFSTYLPEDPNLASAVQRKDGIEFVILVYTALTVVAGLMVWFFVPESKTKVITSSEPKIGWSSIKGVLLLPSVWLIALIVICAYCGYKGMDNYALFAVDAYEMNEVEGAQLSTWAAWIRPFAAVGVGLFADKISSKKATSLCFIALVISYALFTWIQPTPTKLTILYITVFISAVAIYGLRGVYFALLEEASIPAKVTGTAVGAISFIGYTPDIFIMPIAGWLIDRSPGATGHQQFFGLMMGVSLLGLGAVLMLGRLTSARQKA